MLNLNVFIFSVRDLFLDLFSFSPFRLVGDYLIGDAKGQVGLKGCRKSRLSTLSIDPLSVCPLSVTTLACRVPNEGLPSDRF